MELEETEKKKAAKDIRKELTIKVQGGALYLPVAARILLFRQEHPQASIRTSFEQFGERFIAVCQVVENNVCLAQAHKSVKLDATKGPGKDWPFEMAETGAIGRALGLCGYGTLSGDLDEGDQIADTPQKKGKW
jgi:hypothetical protein